MAHASPYNNLDGYLFANEAEKVFRDNVFSFSSILSASYVTLLNEIDIVSVYVR